MDTKQQIFSHDYNLNNFYDIEKVNGSFYKLTNNSLTPNTVYVPDTGDLKDYLRGGYKKKQSRKKHKKNRRKSIRRR